MTYNELLEWAQKWDAQHIKTKEIKLDVEDKIDYKDKL